VLKFWSDFGRPTKAFHLPLFFAVSFSGLSGWCAEKNTANNAPPSASAVKPPHIEMSKEDLLVKPSGKPAEVIGEVVDAWCWASQTMGPGRGEKHKACALACIMGGVTPGIVDDQGNLYIAAKSQGYKGCNELLTPFVAKRVKVQGWLTTKGGCNVMKIRRVTLVN
jgi:hypothetical protein